MDLSREEHFEVVIVGAGLSGVGAAWRLATMCPDKSYAILEGRGDLGGTWDLFRYPGFRSDSDMFTLSYPFRPWTDAVSIAEGPRILRYIRQTAAELGIDRHIRYHHRVTSASWSSADGRWTIAATVGGAGEVVHYSANFLYLCSGYYSYEGGHLPAFPDAESFGGRIIHPQQWPEDLDYRDQRVVIIGSGATSITLAPAMADLAAHVTVLQRSPSYILSLPAVDPLSQRLRAALPEQLASRLMRWKNLVVTTAVYQLCRRRPQLAKRLLRRGVASQLPPGYDIDPHFTPSYDPWDQRMCVVPDGDLFRAIRSGHLSVITDGIERFTPQGIRLQSGAQLEADLVISATGLDLVACGGIRLTIDGRQADPSQAFIYRGFMLSGFPNLALCLGYTNASWTLRADLVSQSVCRLLNRMDGDGYTQAVPVLGRGPGQTLPLLDLSSGYVRRGADRLPKQGTRGPWKFRQNYFLDLLSTKFGDLGQSLSFSSPGNEPDPLGPDTSASDRSELGVTR